MEVNIIKNNKKLPIRFLKKNNKKIELKNLLLK